MKVSRERYSNVVASAKCPVPKILLENSDSTRPSTVCGALARWEPDESKYPPQAGRLSRRIEREILEDLAAPGRLESRRLLAGLFILANNPEQVAGDDERIPW